MTTDRLIHDHEGLQLYQLPVLTDNYIYVLYDKASHQTVVIDPAEAQPVVNFLESKGWSLDAIWNTHHHADHVGGNHELQKRYECSIYGSDYDHDRIPGITQTVRDQEEFQLGTWRVEVFATPGHTLGHCIYYVPAAEILFCGDTLFALGCGRLFEGTAEQMWNSLQRIRTLPGTTRVCCAHEYTLGNARYAQSLPRYALGLLNYIAELQTLRNRGEPTVPTQLAAEVAYNPFLQADQTPMREAIGLPQASPTQVFAWLRTGKDNFKS
ncbi:MAG TPA: hydroxyacylglutathione hydrolase [Oligoflexus sp.]|uniref:hydroxyacylglutathione hydrolase n=1 Tax=Oligoflexus sp. TaxID=1971216 RepID=UPI002D434A23|nr:hydroxyacylglutathione hydrolase [Oligoflexus sp.]HYX34950.1 hydroxyacylglutathione hydrolase [Oligoflexus sp.]